MTKILFFFIAILPFQIRSQDEKSTADFQRTKVITGKIKFRDNCKADTNLTKLNILLEWHRHEYFKTKLDNKFTFKFDSLRNSFGNLKIKSDYYHADTTIYLSSINSDTTFIEIPFPPICKYDYSLKNKKCPKCNKDDKVIPIQYGYSEKEDIKNNMSTYKLGGCITKFCQPHYYCKRDKLDF